MPRPRDRRGGWKGEKPGRFGRGPPRPGTVGRNSRNATLPRYTFPTAEVKRKSCGRCGAFLQIPIPSKPSQQHHSQRAKGNSRSQGNSASGSTKSIDNILMPGQTPQSLLESAQRERDRACAGNHGEAPPRAGPRAHGGEELDVAATHPRPAQKPQRSRGGEQHHEKNRPRPQRRGHDRRRARPVKSAQHRHDKARCGDGRGAPVGNRPRPQVRPPGNGQRGRKNQQGRALYGSSKHLVPLPLHKRGRA